MILFLRIEESKQSPNARDGKMMKTQKSQVKSPMVISPDTG